MCDNDVGSATVIKFYGCLCLRTCPYAGRSGTLESLFSIFCFLGVHKYYCCCCFSIRLSTTVVVLLSATSSSTALTSAVDSFWRRRPKTADAAATVITAARGWVLPSSSHLRYSGKRIRIRNLHRRLVSELRTNGSFRLLLLLLECCHPGIAAIG